MKRDTIQRRIIAGAVRRMRRHPTAEDVYVEVQKEHHSISKATVYRNLHELAEEGEIRAVFLPDSPERFDARTPHHYHFRCRRCGEVFDVDMGYLPGLDKAAADMYGFRVDDHDIVFQGRCPACQEGE